MVNRDDNRDRRAHERVLSARDGYKTGASSGIKSPTYMSHPRADIVTAYEFGFERGLADRRRADADIFEEYGWAPRDTDVLR